MGVRDLSSMEMLDRAYAVTSSKEIQNLYRDWSNTYDQHLQDGYFYHMKHECNNAIRDRYFFILLWPQFVIA